MKCIHAKIMKKDGKGKVHARTGHESTEGEERHSSTLSLTSALDGVVVVNAMTWLLFPLYRRLDKPQGRSGQYGKY
jgi:hypothetical protein